MLLDYLIPGADYSGIILDNSEEEYLNLEWKDLRDKPSYNDLVISNEELKVIIATEEAIKFINSEYDIHSVEPIKVGPTYWHGGYLSGFKLDAKKRLSLELNLPSITIHDVESKSHVLTYKEVSDIIHAIGIKYETDFMRRAARFTAIQHAAEMVNKDSAIIALSKVVW